MNKFRFEAHRGVGTEYPESTLPAFEAAVAQGYDMIELDPKITRDGECVILHDGSIGRTGRAADGSAVANTAVNELDLAYLRSLDFGLWKGESFRGTLIPLLSEVVAFALKNNISLKFDNVFEHFTAEQREKFYSIIEKGGLGALAGFTCDRTDILNEAAKRFPLCELHYDGAVNDSSLAEVRAIAAGHRLTVWVPYPNQYTGFARVEHASKEYCAHIREYAEVGIWLIHTNEELERSRGEYGASIIETDGTFKPVRE